MQPNQSKQRKIKLEMPKDPSGTYANTVMISHNRNEVIFDFIQVMPHDSRARVQRRIVMNPTSAKLFLKALEDNMQKYESKHGDIELPSRPPSLADQLFQGISGGERDDE